LKAQRRQQRIATPFGPLLVKLKSFNGRLLSASPEYEECQRIANEQRIPLSEVYEAVQLAIQHAFFANGNNR